MIFYKTVYNKLDTKVKVIDASALVYWKTQYSTDRNQNWWDWQEKYLVWVGLLKNRLYC